MYILIAGGGKVGSNLAYTLLKMGHEVTLLDNDRSRYAALEARFEHVARYGDATELFVLERAGVERADLVVAVTGDDEDNIIVCQVSKEKYGVAKCIARVNDPRNQPHFDMVGINLTVSATATILALIEHELPAHELVTLLDLRRENLEIVEFAIDQDSPAAGRMVRDLNLPGKSRLISVSRAGRAEIAIGETELRPGDLVMAILEPGSEEDLKRVLMPAASSPRPDGRPDRALPRPASHHRPDAGRHARRGLDAAPAGAADLGPRRRRGLPEVRGRESHRVVQGPGDDRGRVEGPRGGRHAAVCASTGNTSASAAAYCGRAGIRLAVVLPEGAIARGKLAQAQICGARVVAVQGDFDDALRLVRELVERRRSRS